MGQKRMKFLREKEEFVHCKTFSDLQRLKIERMMKHPERPIAIPERPKGPSLAKAPEFVREVMGSSAAAGSGEFHVYRGIRRREQKRNQYFETLTKHEEKKLEFEARLQQNEVQSELRTSKKRQKRLKQKEKAKLAKISQESKVEDSPSAESKTTNNDLEAYLAKTAETDPNQFFAQYVESDTEDASAIKSTEKTQDTQSKDAICCHTITTS